MFDGFHGGDLLATLGRADLTHRRWVSSVVVVGFDWNSILGFNILSGGLIYEGKRSVILEFVPRLVGPSVPIFFWSLCEMGQWVLEYRIRRLTLSTVRNF